ncbi:MAG: M4 family metallopeptidase [Thermomonas hydrothermalis]|uniref:M4 family metallopeptidase n=1 Tax=Thermomonas hydrothermalis TaxID=213588 RepID=UPI0023535C3A|nr:M4 family metallopeptidase [Thermomonas hydrothermalis]MCL6619578.1 M4 family metallopeptidase [Thermomonas hydrothermalis]
MNAKASLLCLAIASTLAVAAVPAEAAQVQRSAVIARANTLVANHATALRRAAGDAFIVRDVIVDADGTEHVRYDRTYNGLPVIGGDVVVHARNGKLTGVSQTLGTAARPGLNARISRDQAIVEAGARFGTHFLGAPTARTVIYAAGVAPVLAHEVVFNGIKADQTPTEMHYIVDANSGRILNQWDGIHTARPGSDSSSCTNPVAATGTGQTLTLGDVVLNTALCGSTYQMVDTTRGNGATNNMAMKTSGMGTVFTGTTNIWGNNLLSNSQTVAADAHYGIATTWDYYKNTFNRNGIANDGKGAISRVHYGRNYANAFWSDSCFCMTFGDGDNGATILPLVALDVAAHEMSHGVMSRTANLIYSGESGGLNEANSDIFGAMVEFYANNPEDTPDYVIGEELFPNNADMRKAIRWMFKPSLDGNSRDCYSSNIGSIDVHYSSGPANHFFYLLAEGAVVPQGFGPGTWANLTPSALVCNGNTALVGIGRAKAAAIWYKAITTYMTNSTNYAGARAATLNAAAALYGNGSSEYNAVAAAWSAVNVN